MNLLLDLYQFLVSQNGLTADLIRYFQGGGMVMYPILVISTVMWTLIFERIVAFHRLEYGDMRMNELVTLGRSCQDVRPGSGLRTQIGRFVQLQRTGDRKVDQRLLEECYLKMLPQIDRNIAAIAVLAMISPLLGLLGTVTGMMTTFDVISVFGTGNSRALAGGISEALITTQTGLMVSIPGVFAAAVLSLRARRLQERLKQSIITLQRIV